MCRCVGVFFACIGVCLCVRTYHGWFSMSILKCRATRDPLVMSDFASVNCNSRSVSCDAFRASVYVFKCMGVCRFDCMYVCMYVCMCVCGHVGVGVYVYMCVRVYVAMWV